MTTGWRRGFLGVGLLLALVLALALLDPPAKVRRPGLDVATEEGAASPPARLGGHKAESDEGTRSDGATAPVERQGHAIAVVDDRGHPVVGATLQVRRQSFSMFGGGTVVEVEAEVGEGGFATVPLHGEEFAIPAPGTERRDGALRYVVRVEPPPGRPDVGWLVDADWPPEHDTLRLPPGATIAGVVVDPRGRPLRDVVATVVAGGRKARTRTDPTGRFRLTQLPPGTHELHFAAPGLHRGDGVASGLFRTATSNARLTLEVRAAIVVTLSGWERGDGEELRVAPAVTVALATATTVPVHAGVATVYGLDEEASYTVHLPPSRSGRTAFAEAVPARAGTLELDLESAVRLTGPIEAPEGLRPSHARVEARLAGMAIHGMVLRRPDGTSYWEVEGLPDRKVEVTAWISRRGQPVARGTLLVGAEAPAPLRLLRVP